MAGLPESISTTDWARALKHRNPPPNGLGLIIGCEKSYKINHKPLKGVVKDLRTLKDTFSQLTFTTLCLFDPTADQVKQLIKTASNLQKNGLLQPDSWKRVVVTFSGHGDRTSLCTKDGKISFEEDIFEPLVSSRDSLMVGIAKLFFLDACRGDYRDPGIDLSTLRYRCRGEESHLVPRGERIPSKGNYLVAYSTLPEMTAFESNGGGCWMQLLSACLLHIDKSVQDVLVDVNKILLKQLNDRNVSLQQPSWESTLHDSIYFHKEAKIIIEGSMRQQLQCSPQHSASYSWQSQDQQSQQGYYSQQTGLYPEQHYQVSSANASPPLQWGGLGTSAGSPAQSQWSSSDTSSPGHYVQHHNPAWDSSPSSLSALSSELVSPQNLDSSPGSLSSPFSAGILRPPPSDPLSSSPLAGPLNFPPSGCPGMLVTPSSQFNSSLGSSASPYTPSNQTFINGNGAFNLTPQSGKANSMSFYPYPSPGPQHLPQNDVNKRGDTLPIGQGLNPDIGKYRGILNTYSQKKIIQDVHWEEEPLPGGGFRACVCAKETSSGRVLKGNCRKVKLSKGEAQEVAAKSLIDQINLPTETTSSKSSKSILKEHYDTKKKEVKYNREELSSGYRCTAMCPGVGYVRGDIKPTIKEAENSAASKALSKLKIK